MEPGESTFESRFLAAHPEVRDQIRSQPEFQRWIEQLPTVVIEEQPLYVRGGDMLRDEEQLIFEWAWEHGFIQQEGLETDQ
jgi:hypothetical protein